jgi:hypothetical protein
MKTTRRTVMLVAACFAVTALGVHLSGEAPGVQTAPEPLSKTCRVTRADDVELQKIEPFKVFDNLYYVGPCYVSVWLVTTPQGHILFDSAQEPFVDHVIAGIKKVGVNLRDSRRSGEFANPQLGRARRLSRRRRARARGIAEDTQSWGPPSVC